MFSSNGGKVFPGVTYLGIEKFCNLRYCFTEKLISLEKNIDVPEILLNCFYCDNIKTSRRGNIFEIPTTLEIKDVDFS